jgi:hypothetical protein
LLEGPTLALASALGYGVSDFVGGMASRRVAALRVVLVSYPIAMVLLAILASIVGGHVTGAAGVRRGDRRGAGVDSGGAGVAGSHR